jgi:16S rRNA (guanine966-N2)-methyltransferase
MNAQKHSRAKQPQRGQVRIIGGKWRGRKLSVAPRPALRPSPDRVRETLFNWLKPYVDGARCLDLYAGTGVLGIEAVSRGAAHATLLDNDRIAIDFLTQHVNLLSADNVEVIESDAQTWLRTASPSPFDIVFLDPPFSQGLVEASLEVLPNGWLKHRAWVYLEAEKIPILHLAMAPWQLIRHGQTSQMQFALLEFNRSTTEKPGRVSSDPNWSN